MNQNAKDGVGFRHPFQAENQRLSLNPLLALTFLLLLQFGCSQGLPPEPQAPVFDQESGLHTRVSRLNLSGTAPAGLELELTRSPSFGPGERPRVQQANAYTSQFLYENVPLKRGENVFELRAIDEHGRKSPAARLKVHYETEDAELKLSASSTTVVAGPGSGRGQLVASAKFEVEAEELAIFADRELVFELQGPNPQTRSAFSDEQGMAQVEFTGLELAGPARLKVSSGDSSESLNLQIIPGPAYHLLLEVDAPEPPNTAPEPPEVDAVIQAGLPLPVRARVLDLAGNVIDAPAQVECDAPGAELIDGAFHGLTQAGEFRIRAWLNGWEMEANSQLAQEAKVLVLAGKAKDLEFVGPAQVNAGQPFLLAARLSDDYGNVVDSEQNELLFTSDDAQAAFSPHEDENEPSLLGPDAQVMQATLHQAGNAILRVSFEQGDLEKELNVEVLPSKPVQLTVSLSSNPPQISGPGALNVPAGNESSLLIEAVARDASGNRSQTPLNVRTSYPGQSPSQQSPSSWLLSGLSKAGSYTVEVRAFEFDLEKRAPFSVLPGNPHALRLDLESDSVAAGEWLSYQGLLVDEFENPLEAEPTLEVLDAGGTPLAAAKYGLDAGRLRIFSSSAQPYTLRLLAPTAPSLSPIENELRVVPGAPARLEILEAGAISEIIRAGAPLQLLTRVEDRYGNQVQDAALGFQIIPLTGTHPPSPGPSVVDGVIQNLQGAGEYSLESWIEGLSTPEGEERDSQVLRVFPAAPSRIEVVASNTNPMLGEDIELGVMLWDEFNNPYGADGPLIPEELLADFGDASLEFSIQLSDAAPTIHSVSLPFTPILYPVSEPKDFKVIATFEQNPALGDPPLVSDELEISVLPFTDHEGPSLKIHRLQGHENLEAWPPGEFEVEPACDDGIVVACEIEDPSGITEMRVSFSGLVSPEHSVSESFPNEFVSKDTLLATLCANQLANPVRGEVLIELVGSDKAGNTSRLKQSWCLDPDAEDLLPAQSPYTRCVPRAHQPQLNAAKAMAMDGDGLFLLLGSQDGANAKLQRLERHADYQEESNLELEGYEDLRALTLFGNTVFATASKHAPDSASAVLRSTKLGTASPKTQVLLQDDSGDGQFEGLLYRFPHLYALWVSSAPSQKLSRVEQINPLTQAPSSLFDPESEAWAGLPGHSLRHFCSGTGEALYAAGENLEGHPVLAQIAEGSVEVLWEGESAAQVSGCAQRDDEVVLSVNIAAENTGHLLQLDLSQQPIAHSLVVDHLSENTPITKVLGPVGVGELFYSVVHDENGNGSLLRLAPKLE